MPFRVLLLLHGLVPALIDFIIAPCISVIFDPQFFATHAVAHVALLLVFLPTLTSPDKGLGGAGKTASSWSEITILRAAQECLATLRNFSVLQGAVNKKIAPCYLPIEAFAYITFYLKQHQPSGVKLIELPDWKLFFLRREGWNAFSLKHTNASCWSTNVAGSVTRLTFAATTFEEYANVLTQR